MGKAPPSGQVLSVFAVVYGLLNWMPLGGTGIIQCIAGRCVDCASCDALLQRFKDAGVFTRSRHRRRPLRHLRRCY
jgi:hypothetical protein